MYITLLQFHSEVGLTVLFHVLEVRTLFLSLLTSEVQVSPSTAALVNFCLLDTTGVP